MEEQDLNFLLAKLKPIKLISAGIVREEQFLNALFKKYIKDRGFICGGFARYCLSPLNDPPPATDIDVYSKSETAMLSIKNDLIRANHKILSETPNSITFNIGSKRGLNVSALQLIKPVFCDNTVEGVLERFDFSIVRAAIFNEWDSLNAVIDEDFIKDEEQRILRVKYVSCPVNMVQRIAKYVAKGYRIPMRESLKLFEEWDNKDQDYRDEVLETSNKEVISNIEVEGYSRTSIDGYSRLKLRGWR
jgi:hypothetical protein